MKIQTKTGQSCSGINPCSPRIANRQTNGFTMVEGIVAVALVTATSVMAISSLAKQHAQQRGIEQTLTSHEQHSQLGWTGEMTVEGQVVWVRNN